MTTYTVYANANDHWVQANQGAAWATARAGGYGITDSPTGASLYFGDAKSGSNYYAWQAQLEFDLSAVPTTSAATKLWVKPVSISGTKSVWASVHTLAGGTSDFVAGGSLSSLGAFSPSAFSLSGTSYQGMTGPADVGTRSSTFGLLLYGNLCRTGGTPAGDETLAINGADTSGTSSDPYLEIIIASAYTLAFAAGSFALTGKDANLVYGRHLVSAKGTFTLTGKAATLTAVRAVRAAVGAFTLSGQAALGKAARRVVAAVGAFSLTGLAIAMGIKRLPPEARTLTFAPSKLDDSRTLVL